MSAFGDGVLLTTANEGTLLNIVVMISNNGNRGGCGELLIVISRGIGAVNLFPSRDSGHVS